MRQLTSPLDTCHACRWDLLLRPGSDLTYIGNILVTNVSMNIDPNITGWVPPRGYCSEISGVCEDYGGGLGTPCLDDSLDFNPPPVAAKKETHSVLVAGLVAGIVSATAVAGAFAAVLLLWRRRQSKRRQQAQQVLEHNRLSGSGSSTSGAHGRDHEFMIHVADSKLPPANAELSATPIPRPTRSFKRANNSARSTSFGDSKSVMAAAPAHAGASLSQRRVDSSPVFDPNEGCVPRAQQQGLAGASGSPMGRLLAEGSLVPGGIASAGGAGSAAVADGQGGFGEEAVFAVRALQFMPSDPLQQQQQQHLLQQQQQQLAQLQLTLAQQGSTAGMAPALAAGNPLQLQLLNMLGRGAYGAVYRAMYRVRAREGGGWAAHACTHAHCPSVCCCCNAWQQPSQGCKRALRAWLGRCRPRPAPTPGPAYQALWTVLARCRLGVMRGSPFGKARRHGMPVVPARVLSLPPQVQHQHRLGGLPCCSCA